MIKATYHTRGAQIAITVESESVKGVFAELASVQETFDADAVCGMAECGSDDIRLQFRQVDDFSFYELACRKCYARLQFGQAKKGGTLFPKRKDEDGRPMPNRGWSRYEKNGNGNSAPRAASPDQHSDAYTTRPIPEELKHPFSLLDMGDTSVIKTTYAFLEGEMKEAGADEGAREYKRITSHVRQSFPQGTKIPPADIKSSMLDLWDAFTRLKIKKPAAGSDSMVIDDSDLPF